MQKNSKSSKHKRKTNKTYEKIKQEKIKLVEI